MKKKMRKMFGTQTDTNWLRITFSQNQRLLQRGFLEVW